MQRLGILLFALSGCLVAGGCGGEQPKTSQKKDSEESIVRQAGETRGLNPLYLSEFRYFDEMIGEEESRAYQQQSGEYIDPRRVMELLREETTGQEEEQQQPQAQPELEKQTEQRSWRISYLSHQEAQKRFEAGDLNGAVRQWTGFLTDDQAFTISVEVDCDSAILRRTYSQLQALETPVFLESTSVGGRNCYRICAGVFSHRGEASEWIAKVKTLLPDSFPFVYVVRKASR